MAAESEERLLRLEERLTALERLVAAPSSTGTPVNGDDRFWALNRLRELAGTPGAVLFTGTVTLPGGAEYAWQEARGTDALLAADWADTAGTLAALGHPVRLLLLRHVLSGKHSVAELTDSDEMGTTGQLYHHLRQLTAAGWLHAAGRGRYEVPAERVVPLLTVLAAAQH